jgi:hypothetical protein
VAPRLGPLRIPWPGGDASDDPYWDFFLNTPAGDPENLASEIIRRAPEGAIFPAKADLHSPEITSSHVKELARYLGAELVGIAGLDPEAPHPGPPSRLGGRESRGGGLPEYPFAVVCAVRAEHDPRDAAGVGGQVPVQNGLFVTFVLSAWIRELGFRATRSGEADAERLAAAAGLGKLNADGRLVAPGYGTKVHVADVILTDLPLVADG